MLTQERLKELLRYEPETGKFYWKVVPSRRVRIGVEAGHIDAAGYIRIRLDGKPHQAHRLAWLYVYGNLPNNLIDHINTLRSDNRIGNLREASHCENSCNAKLGKRNSTGHKGLSKTTRKGAKYSYWRGEVVVKGTPSKNKLFPYTDEGKLQALEWIEATRLALHGEYARHE